MSDCAICLNEYTDENSYKTSCEHTFCFDCIVMWCNGQVASNINPNCPMCRSLLDIIKIKSEFKKKFPTKDENRLLSFDELINLSGVSLHHNMIVIDVAQDKNNFYDSLKSLIRHSFMKVC